MDIVEGRLPYYMSYGEYSGLHEKSMYYEREYKGVIHQNEWYMGNRAMEENRMLQDMDYLQQTYPAKVRSLRKRIAELLDRMDYEGSFVYDAYPDRCTLERMSAACYQVLCREERTFPERGNVLKEKELPEEKSIQGKRLAHEGEKACKEGDVAERNEIDVWKLEEIPWIKELVQVLLCEEICKRRHGGKRGCHKFLL